VKFARPRDGTQPADPAGGPHRTTGHPSPRPCRQPGGRGGGGAASRWGRGGREARGTGAAGTMHALESSHHPEPKADAGRRLLDASVGAMVAVVHTCSRHRRVYHLIAPVAVQVTRPRV
jgi:hypothetical protein